MDEFLKTLASIVTLIGGLLALGKGALELIKEYQENKATISTLLTRQRLWIGGGLVLFVIAVAIYWQSGLPGAPQSPDAATKRATPTGETQSILTVQIWDVEVDHKHQVVASTQFNRTVGNSLSDESLQQVGAWITDQLNNKYNLSAPNLHIHVHVPADLSKEHLNVEVDPPGPLQKYFWVVFNGSIKSRNIVTDQGLASVGQDFWLELSRSGYEVKPIQVPWGRTLDQDLTLNRLSVGIGIEEFTGDKNSVATRLTNYLVPNQRLSIKDPNALAALTDEINKAATETARNPVSQVSRRTSLGLDFIISGNYQAH